MERNYNGGTWLDRNSVDSMGSHYKTVYTVLHGWVCAKMTADDGVFGDLRISAEIGDSESQSMRKEETRRTEPLAHLSFVRVSESCNGCVRRFG